MAFPATREPNKKPLFLSQSFEASLAVLVGGLDRSVALSLLLGEFGSGKTTLINFILEQIQKNFAIVVIDTPSKYSTDLLNQVLSSFTRTVKSSARDKILKKIQQELVTNFDNQQQQASLLIIDNAENLSSDALEGIRQLLDLNSHKRVLLQIILVGQNKLKNLIDASPLSDKVGVECLVGAQSADETHEYINYRLKIADAPNQDLFDELACSAIYKFSKGNLGEINLICNEALSLCYDRHKQKISEALIIEAVNNLKFQNDNHTDIGTRKTADSFLYKKQLIVGLVLSCTFFGFLLLWERYFLPMENDSFPEKIEDVVKNYQNDQSQEQLSKLTNSLNVEQAPKKIFETKGQQEKQPTKQLTKTTSNQKDVAIDNPDQMLQLSVENGRKAKEAANTVSQPAKVKRQITQGQSFPGSDSNAIGNLLAVADTHLRALRLSTPKGQNALEIYQIILTRDPNNKAAQQGIKQVAEKYREIAEQKLQQGSFDMARQYLDKASKLDPYSTAIQTTRSHIDKQVKTQKDLKLASIKDNKSYNNKIARLLKKAERQLANAKLTEPVNDNAYQTYQEILTLDKNNTQAKQGMQKIFQRLKLQAQNALRKKDYKTALKTAELILDFSSTKKADEPSLEKAVFAAFETKTFVDKKIEKLLGQAEKQRQTDRLLTPPGDNALESYQDILQIDSGNHQAKNGLRNLEKQYQELVNSVISKGETERALTLLNEALNAFPKNRTFQTMRKKTLANSTANIEDANKESSDNNKEERGLKSFGTF